MKTERREGLILAKKIYLQARWVRGKISVEGLAGTGHGFAVALKRSWDDPQEWRAEEITVRSSQEAVEDQIARALGKGVSDYVLFIGDAKMMPLNEENKQVYGVDPVDAFCGSLYSVKGHVAHYASTIESCERAYIDFDSVEEGEQEPERGFPDGWGVVTGDPLHIPKNWKKNLISSIEDNEWN